MSFTKKHVDPAGPAGQRYNGMMQAPPFPKTELGCGRWCMDLQVDHPFINEAIGQHYLTRAVNNGINCTDLL
jgi:hypothetical protein